MYISLSFLLFSIFVSTSFASGIYFQSIDFLSNSHLCGSTEAGTTRCFDWSMTELWVPDSVTRFSASSDVVAHDYAVCGYDVNAEVKCVENSLEAEALKSLMASSIPGSVVANLGNACGIEPGERIIHCRVLLWSRYVRRSFRAAAKAPISLIDVASRTVCWSDGNQIECRNEDGQDKIFPLPGATAIKSLYKMICARNSQTAKCWKFDGTEITLSSEFQTARVWFKDYDQLLGAIMPDNRIVMLDATTGHPFPRGSGHIPAAYEEPRTSEFQIWSNSESEFCTLENTQIKVVCWKADPSRTALTREINFGEPVRSLITGRSEPCVLLQSGQLKCRSYNGPTVQSLPTGDTIHVRIWFPKICAWNKWVNGCAVDDKFGAFESILWLESDFEFSSSCALGRRHGSHEREIICHGAIATHAIPIETKNASAISVWNGRACAISSGGIFCWGDRFIGLQMPSVVNPSKVQLAANYGCALDDLGLVCWGDLESNELVVPRGLESSGAVKDFALGDNRACAVIDDGSIKCWGKKSSDGEEPPAITGVKSIYGSRQNVFCAINPTGLHCWGGDTLFPR